MRSNNVFLLVLALLSCYAGCTAPAFAQKHYVQWTPLAATFAGTGPSRTYGDGYAKRQVDSLWAFFQANGTIAGDQIDRATLYDALDSAHFAQGQVNRLGYFEGGTQTRWPWQVASAISGASVTAGKVAVASGAAPAPTLHVRYTGTLVSPIITSFTNGIAFLPTGNEADTVVRGQGGDNVSILSATFSEGDSVAFDSLSSVEDLSISVDSTFRSLEFPNLQCSYTGETSNSPILINFTGSKVDTFTLPRYIGSYTGITIEIVGDGCTLSLISLPVLKFIAVNGLHINPSNDTAYNLTTLSIPNLIAGNIIAAGPCPRLVNLQIGTIGITKQLNVISFPGAALSQASVDSILALLVSLDGTNGTTLWSGVLDLSGGTSSPPSVAGAANAAILTDRGATVTTN